VSPRAQLVNYECILHRYAVTAGSKFDTEAALNCISSNAPNLASCSFIKHELILIIFSKQHQHTFRNYVPFQLSLSLHFCLLYYAPPLGGALSDDAV